MIYYNFIKKDKKYLKSVRFIKDHVSFDMVFPKTWDIIKNVNKGIEVITNESNDVNIKIISFVTSVTEDKVNEVERVIEEVIKVNIEREEKEKLFKDKVMELKSIFSNQKLDNLKNLKFDIDDIQSILDEKELNHEERDRSRNKEIGERETEDKKGAEIREEKTNI